MKSKLSLSFIVTLGTKQKDILGKHTNCEEKTMPLRKTYTSPKDAQLRRS
jgi:hypothetical protein